MTASCRRSGRVLLLAILVLTCVPAGTALAASATITNDSDTSVPLSPGMTVRHMSPDVGFVFAADELRYSALIKGPAGQPASDGRTCVEASAMAPERAKYSGDGTYTVTLQVFKNADDLNCAQPPDATQTFTFAIDTVTRILTPKAGATLIFSDPARDTVESFSVTTQDLKGADKIVLRYARDAKFGADGGITGTFQDSDTPGTVFLTGPGSWTVQARPQIFVDGEKRLGSWSPPVTVKVLSAFQLAGDLGFPDARGPSYKISGRLGERSTRGTITISIAKGLKGGKFRKLGVARIRSGGKFSLRFTVRKFGVHRLRFVFKGSATTARGTIVYPVNIARVLG